MIYFITVNYNCADLIAELIDSIQSEPEIDFQIVIVNNSVGDLAIAKLGSDQVQIINAPSNIGFGRACNLALSYVYDKNREAIAWIINPDALIAQGDSAKLLDLFDTYPEISILGTIISASNDKLSFTGGVFIPESGLIIEEINSIQLSLPYRVTQWVSACSLILSLKLFPECPYFDPDYFLYYEDFDFCMRYAAQGHEIRICDRLKVIHNTSSITSRNFIFKRKHEIYSYLLSLEKHAPKNVLVLRLIRICIAAILQVFIHPKASYGKLLGIKMYCDRLFKLSKSRIS